MLELLNPASALKILQRFDPPRRQTILATASPETNQEWMRNQTYPRTYRWAPDAATAGSFPVRKQRLPKRLNRSDVSPEKRSLPTDLLQTSRRNCSV
jgi:hypothetical protein